MSIYSLAVRTTNGVVDQACLEIYTPATQSIRIMEIGISQTVATSGVYGLGRPAAPGLVPVPVAFLAEQNTADPAAKTNASLSWGTSPTAPASYLRRVITPASIGAGAIWTFPRGLMVAASSSLVIFNITATQLADVWVVIDE